MKLQEAIAKAKINNADTARILGKTPGTITNRLKKDSELTVSEMLKIEAATGVSLIPRPANIQDWSKKAIEIPYLEIEGIPQESFKGRVVTEVFFDYQIVTDEWNYKIGNLRATKMLGDKMAGGDYPLKNEDTLLVDITQTNIFSPGVYVFTTNDKNVFISGIMPLISGDTKFYFYNKNYPEKILTDEKLKESRFKVIGRVIKNLSLRI